MRTTLKKSIAVVILLFVSASCQKIELEKGVPECIEEKIREIKREPAWNPPAEVWEWKVDGSTYYYFTSDCCDQLNLLYDGNCNEVCAPDGGISGAGDGRCPEFIGTIERTLVWRDEE